MKAVIAALALAAAGAASAGEVIVLDYTPQPWLRLRLMNSTPPECKGRMEGQLTHRSSSVTVSMCWHIDEVSQRLIVFYPEDGTMRAFAREDLVLVAKYK